MMKISRTKSKPYASVSCTPPAVVRCDVLSWTLVTPCSLQGYREDEQLLLESDADEQLLIHINFNASAKLRSILIAAPNDDHAPKHVKLFANRATIGFSEAEEEGAVQTFELSEENLAGKPVPLKYALV